MKKALSLILILCMTISLLFANSVMAAPAVTFSDVTAGTDLGNAIYKLVEDGVVVGYPDGTFKPNNNLTRAELTKMINLVFGYTEADTAGFSDVTDADWFKPYVLVAKKAGYIKGFEDGSFRGNQNLTREQACAIIARCANLLETKMFIKISDPVSDWADADVKKVIAAGFMSLEEGDKFRAKEDITRGELALLLKKYIDTKTPVVVPPAVSVGGGGGGGAGGGGGDTTPPITPPITPPVIPPVNPPVIVTYTVTFNSDGGSPVANQTVNEGATVTKPFPTKEGYTFDKWVKEDGTEFNFSTPISSNLSLKATWLKKKFLVVFDFNGGTLNGEDIYEVENVEWGTTVARPDDPSREPSTGFTYEFKGYTLSPSSRELFDFATLITDNLRLYALWEEEPIDSDQTELLTNLNGIIANFNNYQYDTIYDEDLLLKVLEVKNNLLIAFQGAVDAINRGEIINEQYLKDHHKGEYDAVKAIYDSIPDDGADSMKTQFDNIFFEIGDTYLTVLFNYFGISMY